MVIYYFFPLLTAFLWAAINHFDKYLLEKYLKGSDIGSLVIFSSLIGLPAALLILLFKGNNLIPDFFTACLLIINGSVFVLSIIPYFHAMSKDEASIVAPLSQFAPLFSLILGFLFLHETLSKNQLLSFILIIIGAIFLLIERDEHKRVKFKSEVMILMVIFTFFQALNSFLFKFIYQAESMDFWALSFWQYLGYFITAILLLCTVKPYRQQFIKVFKKNKFTILSLNFLNEVIATVAGLSLQYASIFLPLALVSVIADGVQPLFVLLLGILLTIFFPKISQEDISLKKLVQKLLAILFVIGGTVLLVI